MADEMGSTSTDKSSSDGLSPFAPPQIVPVKGGGAIRGMGEKFSANPVTGTGSLTVPIAVSPGRSGFGPQLSLSYDSGTGNGPFGMGWTLSLPAITRKTDKGLPKYRDHFRRQEESDVFILSGAEDLVPALHRDRDHDSKWAFDSHERDGYHVRLYRPRIEGLFARIERWTRLSDGDIHWRSISKDNILTIYGFDEQSRIADPDNPDHVFSWLICRSFDDKGNAIIYEYAAENGVSVDMTRPNERNRRRTANRYLKRVNYGNRRPLLLGPDAPGLRLSHTASMDLDNAGWMFEVVFDYGDENYMAEPPGPDGSVFVQAGLEVGGGRHWPMRKDPFSSYRSGFEVRSYRLCRRALTFHHFPDDLGCRDCLVRSTAFEYHEKPIGSFITRVTQSGHKRQDDGRYLTRSLPALDLNYTASPLEDKDYQGYRLNEVNPSSVANLPEGIDGDSYRFVDLDGEGISGVLAEQADAWYYKPNLGEGRFGATEAVASMPSTAALSGGRQQLLDIAGDGNLDLVTLEPPAPGFFERTLDAGWEGFRPFDHLPVQDWKEPNLRFVDVTGDGIADVLVTDDNAYTWYPSLLNEGFGEAVRVHIPLEEEKGPRVIFADGTQSIYLADMSGDGLSDLVRIRTGEVCYWPNRGYGHFGAKVTMDRAPWFDHPDLFEQQRVRLADTDGNGLTDILYLGRDAIRVFLNESGNAWSTARVIEKFPVVDNIASVSVIDLLGRGTACLLWSSPLPGDTRRPLRYVDLMGGKKPHLLERVKNNLGAETVVEYASSTEFYLADKAAGTPWVTRLPFPVHVVKRVETYDYVSRNRFVARYTYHHGFYDGLEREFRGFGRVDQLDTEDIASLTAPGNFPTGDNISETFTVPPVLTKTWFHTGVFIANGRISRHLEHEYYRGGSGIDEARVGPEHIDAVLLDDTILPSNLMPEEAREACRALKGSMLRQEVYALDDAAQTRGPYTVAERNFTIRLLQPRRTNLDAVFFTHPREAISLSYERNPADPRISHALTLEVDDFGNVLRSVAIGYQRHKPVFDEQSKTLAILTESLYTNAILHDHVYRTPLPAEVKTFELTAPMLKGAEPLDFAEIDAITKAASEIAYEMQPVPQQVEKRLIEQVRSLYRKDDLSSFSPLGQVESMALPGESYKLALSSGLLDIFQIKASPAELIEVLTGPQGEYRDLEGNGSFWIPSGRVYYSRNPDDSARQELTFAQAHFFLPHRFQDPFGNATIVAYDGKNNLSVVFTRDAIGNETTAELDYRVLQTRLVTDPNGNRTEARFDARGMLAGTALRGKAKGPIEGDSFDDFVTDLTPAEITEFFDSPDPRALANSHLGTATTRILYDLQRVAICATSIARETHVSALAPGQQTKVQLHFVYSDGFGRVAQTKVQAEPGPLDPSDPNSPVLNPRWVGTGARIYNNKAKPVRQYEPFFSPTPQFGIEKWGVSRTLFYDPLQRVVATLHPNHIFEKVVFDPWRQITYDVNDTVTFNPKTDPNVGEYFRRLPDSDYLPTWYQQRINGALGPDEKAAAEKAAKHANTPSIAEFDSLGRTFLTVVDNGKDPNGRDQKYCIRTVLDIEGNQREIIDALNRVTLRFDYDMLGTRLYQASMDAGERWMLNDVTGKPIHAWNSRQYGVRTLYDPLRRPLKSFVRGGDPSEPHAAVFAQEILFEWTVYGDSPDTGLSEFQQTQANLRGKVLRHFDGAGVITTDLYDFKGNLLRGTRRFAGNYKNALDWYQNPALEAQTFSSFTAYDALNRAVAVTAPDDSIYRPKFNEANLLEKVDVNLRGAQADGQPVWTPFVTYLSYNAKGQRTIIQYANGAATAYDYDDETFQLIHLKTTRAAGENRLTSQIFMEQATVQDLSYTYDPVGNIIRIEDAALQTVFYANHRVESASDYTYDPLYRLIEATGRENIGQSAFAFAPPDENDRDYPFVGAAKLHDLQALRNYTERYDYDPVGNFDKLFHRATDGNWTRAYSYDETSLIEPTKKSNRLSQTALHTNGNPPAEPYSYDAHGNITQMPHLPMIQWNFKDELSASSRQVVNTSVSETTYYVYDAGGQRARKITERRNGTRKNERFYLNGFEIYREFEGRGAIALERETLHVMDDKQRISLVETRTFDNGLPVAFPVPVQRYQLANHLGSACLELDAGGGLISYEEYSTYGNTTFQAGRSAAEVSLKRYRYTAKERDEENGFTYHGARYYAPWLARWTACDSIWNEDLYCYVRNNPLSFHDLDGKDDEKPGFWKRVRQSDTVQFLGGVLAGTATSFVPGGFLAAPIGQQTGVLETPSRAFQAGYGAGEFATGVTQIVTAAGGEVGGFILDATGVGAVAGVPINVASAAVAIQGGGNVGAGLTNFMQAVKRDPEPKPAETAEQKSSGAATSQNTPQETPTEVPESVSKNQAAQDELLKNQQQQVKDALDEGGARAKGRVLDAQGTQAENITRDTLKQVPDATVNQDVKIGTGDGSVIDNTIARGDKTVYVESKLTISDINERTVNQLTNATKVAKPGDSVILQVTRAPTLSEVAKLKSALGDDVFSKVKIISNQTDLFNAVKSALK